MIDSSPDSSLPPTPPDPGIDVRGQDVDVRELRDLRKKVDALAAQLKADPAKARIVMFEGMVRNLQNQVNALRSQLTSSRSASPGDPSPPPPPPFQNFVPRTDSDALSMQLLEMSQIQESEIEGLQTLVHALTSPHGSVFIAYTGAGDGTFTEVYPTTDHLGFEDLQYGRAATGTNDADCPLTSSPFGYQAVLALPTGTTTAYVPLGFSPSYGVIKVIEGDCLDLPKVIPSTAGGALLKADTSSNRITLSLVNDGGDCDPVINACLNIGDVVMYIPTSDTTGLMLNVKKQIELRYTCSSSTANIPDLASAWFHDNDFDLVQAAFVDCDRSPHGPRVRIYTTGNIVKDYGGTTCERVKEFDFVSAMPPGDGQSTVGAYHIVTCSDATPPVSDCDDPLGRKKINVATGWTLDAYDTACVPTDYHNIGNSTDDAADTETWSRGGTAGVKITIQTRTKWITDSFFQYQVVATLDKCGRLSSVGEETKTLVVAGVDCPDPT